MRTLNAKQGLSLALVLLMLLPAFASCASGTDEAASSASSEAGNAAPSAPETEPEPVDPWLDDLPDSIDLNGRTFNILSRVEGEIFNEFVTDEMTGEVINDAIFQRNLNLEARLNASLENTEISGGDNAATAELERNVTAGSADYDLFCSNSYRTAESAYKGYLLNLAGLEYVDLSKPYWANGLNEAVSMGGKQYIATGPMSLGFYRYMMVDLFNKNLFAAAEVEMPYQTVLNGKWTLDVQNTLAEGFYQDLNGNGEKDDEDRFGYVTRMAGDTSINDGYWASLNLRSMSKDADDYYVYDVDEERFVNGIDALLRLMNGNGTARMCANDNDIYMRFVEGKAAMTVARLYIVETGEFRDMDDDYGILPMPKASEDQADYYSYDQDQFLVYGIPKSVAADDTDNIGMFLEAYASESWNILKPAYYETALTVKYVNDEESAAMLDKITEGMYIDPSNLYLTMINFNSMNLLRTILLKNENIAASMIASNAKAVQKTIEKINDAYRGME